MEKYNMSYSIIANKKLKDKGILYGIRREMVEYYYSCKSYRKAASYFGVNVKTVLKWVKRYKEGGLRGLRDLPRKPKVVHNKVRKEVEELVVKLRKQSHFGAMRLKMEFELPISAGAINRILKERGLLKRQRRKHEKKRDLREVKMKLKPFEVIQVDIKYTDDIPEFFPYYLKYKLPKYQITARDVRTGLLYYFYTYEKSVTYTIMAMKILLTHLFKYGIKPGWITIQTDNGSEFSGIRIHHNRGFKKYLEKDWGTKHRYIPPHYPNANADVESSHKLIEDEFYSLEHINSKEDFMNKAATYQYYFNFMRKNSYKEWKTPVDILKEYNICPNIALLSPIILDTQFENTGQMFDPNLYYNLYHHVHVQPVFWCQSLNFKFY